MRVYCDQNFLIRIGKENGEYKAGLQKLVREGEIVLVLSAWHWVEMAQGKNQKASLALADFADSLQPMWIRERRILQRHEVEAAFFAWLNIPYTRPDALASRGEVIAEISRKRPQVVAERTSRDIVSDFTSHPELMNPLHKSYAGNVIDTNANRRACKAGHLGAGTQRDMDRHYVDRLLPKQTPTGLLIDRTSKDRFLDNVDIQTCPAIATEFAVTDWLWSTTGRTRWQDHMDRNHVIPALPYVDLMATNDNDLTKMIHAVKANLQFSTACPVTKESFDHLYVKP